MGRGPAKYIDRVFNLLRPASGTSTLVSQCALCHAWPSQPVCSPCESRFGAPQRRCRKCALLMPPDISGGARDLPNVCWPCQKHPPPVVQTWAALTYAFPWSNLIARYKFGQQPGWAPLFAQLMLKQADAAECLAQLKPSDWVLPLPLAPQRLRSRGFNQSWLLVQHLVRQSATAAQADATLLMRIRDTLPQSDLQREERLTNVQGAFMVDPLRAQLLAGRHVVLVDDVMTSGASVYTAALALLSAGASQVTACVLARTEP